MKLVRDAKRIYQEDGSFELVSRSFSFFRRQVKNRFYKFRYTTIGEPVLTMETPAGTIEFEVSKDYPRLVDIASGEIYEALLLEELNSLLSKDDVFYDVGACWGVFSIFADKYEISPTDIHTFEADPERYEILRRNLPRGMPTNRNFVSDNDEGDHMRLDTYTETHSQPTVMKLDIEGAEASLIRGAKDLLSESKPKLYIEMHPGKICTMGDSQEYIVDELVARDYDVTINLDHRIRGEWTEIADVNLPTDGDYLLRAV